MKFFSDLVLTSPGHHISMVSDVDGGYGELLALVWVDRNPRYFISTTGSTARGVPYSRYRWRQTISGPRRVNIEVEQPKVVEKYYATCAAIDQHNRCRQDDLQLERKIGVSDWDKRVNMGILGFCIVDAWKLYKAGM